MSRSLLALACLLASGGWVCDGSSDNRCPGAVTCDIEIANVCCPLGTVDWCDGTCSDAGCGGGREVHYCDDIARILDCSFNATIDSATCGSPVSTPHGSEYLLSVHGTFTGCGQEGVQIYVDSGDGAGVDADCGSWEDGVYGGCVSTAPDTTTTHYSFNKRIIGDGATIMLQRMHGSAPPIATMTVACGAR